MVGEPVQQGSGQPLGPERFRSFVERQVAGHQHGVAFVAPAEDFEQQFGAGRGERHEALTVTFNYFCHCVLQFRRVRPGQGR